MLIDGKKVECWQLIPRVLLPCTLDFELYIAIFYALGKLEIPARATLKDNRSRLCTEVSLFTWLPTLVSCRALQVVA